ncbi:hypothetical protein GT354_05340 [Streptomyces sp. SID3343]|nr:hypothetical protein [Streptomyces sp. SID3343]MYV97710.1 hypothetical protein [Streptomyces sp. SID3343]
MWKSARGPLAVSALTATAAGLLFVVGCSTKERICTSEEYPVKAVGSSTGVACVSDGREPDPGYVRYPEGQVPEHLDDKWDKHWRDVVFDADGNITAS